MPRTGISARTRKRAKALRCAMTAEEQIVWRRLRELNRLGRSRFRRQAPIGRFIVDFVDYSRRLIIEIDGGQHAGNVRDQARDRWLESQGFVILRFWNSDIRQTLTGVLDHIARAMDARAPLHTGSSQ